MTIENLPILEGVVPGLLYKACRFVVSLSLISCLQYALMAKDIISLCVVKHTRGPILCVIVTIKSPDTDFDGY